jgi:hypothetical protein
VQILRERERVRWRFLPASQEDGDNELNVGAGWAFKKGAFVVTPLAYAVAGKEDGQLGLKLELLVAADRGGWKLAAFLADYIPRSGDVESYVVLDTLDFTRAIGTRWELGVQTGFFKTGDACSSSGASGDPFRFSAGSRIDA